MAEAQGVLGRIVSAKTAELARRFDDVSIDSLRARARSTRRSLAAAISGPGSRFILEIKKASPSAGAIRPGASAADLARGYRGVADALSVLTDREFFGGSLDDLAEARGNFDGPILAKDFFIDPRQVVEARIAGADGVLVMLSVLSDAEARTIIGEAERLGMEAVVEVHDESEMHRALALGSPLIGINNRDLRDLSIDLSATERLAPLAAGRLLLSESGIAARADVERLAGLVDGFLVGSALMRAERPALAARELIFGRVKLCGLNRIEDVGAGAPAVFVGLVCVPGSYRHVTADQAAPIAGTARRAGMLPVAVLRDAPLAVASDLATLLNLHAVQLHGREDSDYVRQLRRQLPESCEIWTALSVGRDPPSGRGGDRLLFDNGDGGTGRTFDWRMVRRHPRLAQSVVAGGIGPTNVASAAALGAYAIDVGSSVDMVPGLKSAAKIGALFEALRPNSRKPQRQCA